MPDIYTICLCGLPINKRLINCLERTGGNTELIVCMSVGFTSIRVSETCESEFDPLGLQNDLHYTSIKLKYFLSLYQMIYYPSGWRTLSDSKERVSKQVLQGCKTTFRIQKMACRKTIWNKFCSKPDTRSATALEKWITRINTIWSASWWNLAFSFICLKSVWSYIFAKPLPRGKKCESYTFHIQFVHPRTVMLKAIQLHLFQQSFNAM